MEISTRLIKRNVWKIRSAAWKDKKQSLNINKNSFKQYQRDSRFHHVRSSRRRDFGYICPQTASLENYNNRADLLFIILASSNFLHSGIIFNQLTYNLSENLISYSSPSRPYILMV
ncbi:unnamed protein product [Rhizophagus irregularis]|nr:unnamed protein product [Rhizophagus irregularis]